MKIEKIEWNDPIATVTFVPIWIEKLFGVKSKIIKYFDSGKLYISGGEWKWFNEDGSVYGRFPELDNFIRQQEFQQECGDKVNTENELIHFQKEYIALLEKESERLLGYATTRSYYVLPLQADIIRGKELREKIKLLETN